MPFLARADNYGDKMVFNIDKTYDLSGRAKVLSTLNWVGDKIYFYCDDQWWQKLDAQDKKKYSQIFQNLDVEFSKNIYPKLTQVFGSDINPSVSHDGKIIALIHPMVKDAGGYINTGDGYSKYQAPGSNEREMVYLSSNFLDAKLEKAYLAHEFTHLITFNQKDRRGIFDDVWLNEARAEYASTILGYDNPFLESNFRQRVESFLSDSSISLVQWLNRPANYGASHLFMQYLVDQYGIKILSDSMASDKAGIDSINYALQKNNFNIDFIQVFHNWMITVAANDCRLGKEYCYKFNGLQNFMVLPKINYLPNSSQALLSVAYSADYFSGNWQKIVGGNGDLAVNFSSDRAAKFLVPYLLCYFGANECKIGDLAVDNNGKATLNLADFSRQYASLTLMPFASGKTAGFNDYNASSFSYSIDAKITPRLEADQIAKLMAQIETLKKEINRIIAILIKRGIKPIM